VNPYHGEGISAALISGIHAAQAIARFVDGHDMALREYSDWVHAFFTARYDVNGSEACFWETFARLDPKDLLLV
jgi:flavin-dependent dehydrogenase